MKRFDALLGDLPAGCNLDGELTSLTPAGPGSTH
jgi:hypothetical protein